jgi:UDP-N-acetylglucosamine transferase subunit ALG13
MIVITVGTIFFPFDRVINWLEVLLKKEIITEPVLLQHGSTTVKFNHPLLTSVVSLSRRDIEEAVQQASLVISHAGQGSTRMLADKGACFVLLPRLKRYEEHVDDHQLSFARAMEKFGIHHCTEFDQLVECIKHPPSPFRGNFFQASLLVEHLASQYGSQ